MLSARPLYLFNDLVLIGCSLSGSLGLVSFFLGQDIVSLLLKLGQALDSRDLAAEDLETQAGPGLIVAQLVDMDLIQDKLNHTQARERSQQKDNRLQPGGMIWVRPNVVVRADCLEVGACLVKKLGNIVLEADRNRQGMQVGKMWQNGHDVAMDKVEWNKHSVDTKLPDSSKQFSVEIDQVLH